MRSNNKQSYGEVIYYFIRKSHCASY